MKIFLFLSFLLNFIISKLYSSIEWDLDSLFNYTATKIYSGEEQLQYFIIDPDEILNISAKNIILDKMETFYYDTTNKTVFIYLIIFNTMNKTLSNFKTLIEQFSSKMNYEFPYYKDDSVIISAFAIEDDESIIIRGSNIKSMISDSTAADILFDRRTDLRNKNYDKAMEDLIDVIIKYYTNYQENEGISTWILVLIIVLSLVITIVCIVGSIICGCGKFCENIKGICDCLACLLELCKLCR